MVPPREEADERDTERGVGNGPIAEMFLRENAQTHSLMTPMPGRIMMYTAGCE